MLTIPNLIWTRNKPVDYNYRDESKVLLVFERVGQAACTVIALIFSSFNLSAFTPWSIWLIVSFLLMLLYEVCWVRYFRGKRTEKNFYRSFLGIPVPLATLPIAAFLLLGVYGKVIWMVIATVILGIGHIGIHLEHLGRVKSK